MFPRRSDYSERKTALKRNRTIQEIRDQLRKQMQEKMRLERYTTTSANRDKSLFSSILADIQQKISLYQNKLKGSEEMETFDTEEMEIFDTVEMLRIFEDVEQEILQNAFQVEAEQYSACIDDETNALLGNMKVCRVCNKFIESLSDAFTVICNECFNLHLGTESL